MHLAKPIILAIETSCDDTAAAVIANGEIISNTTFSQIDHAIYGGVVPELAARKHQEKIVAVVTDALQKAGCTKKDLNAIAFTKGPGLMGSLIVGVSFAKSLALALDIPMIEVNHMQGHVLAHFIDEPKPTFPFICLTVSGGHTQFVYLKDYLDMEILGQTIDDAAGEAFDKTGKILGLGYPAGPKIDKLARQGNAVYSFAKPKIAELDMSFSGLKTSILYFLQKEMKANPNFIADNLADICASVQQSIITILLEKMKLAADKYGVKQFGIAGGVSANGGLRQQFKDLGDKEGWQTFIPAFQYCTDNAAMIAITAHHKYTKGQFTDQSVKPVTRLSVSET